MVAQRSASMRVIVAARHALVGELARGAHRRRGGQNIETGTLSVTSPGFTPASSRRATACSPLPVGRQLRLRRARFLVEERIGVRVRDIHLHDLLDVLRENADVADDPSRPSAAPRIDLA
jgi:hypothetical protein